MNKFTLITGGASGLGKDLAELFAKDNNNLFLVSSNTLHLNEAKKELEEKFPKIKVEILTVDLSKPENFKLVSEFTTEKGMFINNLVNCSGFGDRTDFKDMDIDRQIKMTELNCNAPLYLTHFYLKDMLKNNEGQIMNIASIAGFMTAPFMSTYHATKAYLLLLGEAISRELKGTNVHLTTICPGPFDSNFVNVAKSHYEFEKIKTMTSKQVAVLSYKAFKKKKTISVIGFKNKLLLFAIRFVPRKLVTNIAASIMKEKDK